MGITNWFKKKATAEDVEKAFKKVKSDFSGVRKENKALKEELENKTSKKEVELMIKESALSLEERLKVVRTEPNFGPLSEPKTEPNVRTKPKERNFEAQMLKKAIKSRPEAIKIAISTCMDKDMRTTDMFNTLVKEKKICGKTQFYHYLSLVRSGGITPNQDLSPDLNRTEPNDK